MEGKISLINLIAFYSEKNGSVKELRAVDVIYPDLSKAFSTASRHSLPDELMRYCLHKQTVRWHWKLAKPQGPNGCDQWHKVQLEACLFFNKDKTRIAGSTAQISLTSALGSPTWDYLCLVRHMVSAARDQSALAEEQLPLCLISNSVRLHKSVDLVT